ncbi:hypothetical protein [Mesoplasma corruscae]|uniref:Transposase n=1 Tax=Mesoplasma corruscae TaxID=216874 RepID=A0A2S5RGX7_9MOLU|nr:hypothetical protein [Mesoplasma corruscae]PPE06375.1 transposase [Mesoplasma corruscae]
MRKLSKAHSSRAKISLYKRINSATEWIKEFIQNYNEKYAFKIDETKNLFVPWEPHEVDMDFALSTLYSRKVLNGSTIKFENKNYATFNKNGTRVNLTKKQEVMIVKTFTGEIFANYYTNFYSLIEIDKEKFVLENINIEVQKLIKLKQLAINEKIQTEFIIKKSGKNNLPLLNISI